MKNTTPETNKTKIILWIFILAYIVYFSYYTILRYQTLYAYYLDLGIMHQTVFNTYRAITNFDFSRVLEQIEPFGLNPVKRMAIHNDIILAPLALFYFIYASPATLLIIQAAVLGLGAWFVFKISQMVFTKSKYQDLLSLFFAFGYLLYPPLEKANMFDFHAVTLATTFLLAMFYFWLKKSYGWSLLFVILALLTKEQVGLTTAFFGLYALFSQPKDRKKNLRFPLLVIGVSLAWFVLSIFAIIPYFRGGQQHFALSYFGDFGDSPGQVLLGLFLNPLRLLQSLLRIPSWEYLRSLLGPLGFLSLFSPLQLVIAAPELGINLLSASSNFRNIYYHYSAVITPFVFISAIYGVKNIMRFLSGIKPRFIISYIIFFILILAYCEGPLPLARNQEIHPFKYPRKEAPLVREWSARLKDENLKISSTGKLAPFFTSRRYFYNFSKYYPVADYLVIMPSEVYNYSIGESLVPVYKRLQQDGRFELIFKQDNFEVYKKL